MPLEINLTFVDRSLERLGCLCLRHTCHLCHISSIVAVGSISRMINGKQITIAVAILCGVGVHTSAMSVVRMAVETRAAY